MPSTAPRPSPLSPGHAASGAVAAGATASRTMSAPVWRVRVVQTLTADLYVRAADARAAQAAVEAVAEDGWPAGTGWDVLDECVEVLGAPDRDPNAAHEIDAEDVVEEDVVEEDVVEEDVENGEPPRDEPPHDR